MTGIIALPCAVLAYGDDVGVVLLVGAIIGACIGFIVGKPAAGTALGLILAFPVWLVVGIAVVGLAVLAGVNFD